METDLLKKADEVIKRVKVTNKEAIDALEKNGGDVLKTIMYLEDKSTSGLNELSQKAYEFIKDEPKLVLSRNHKELAKVPAIAGLGVVLLGLWKPKLLGLGILGFVLSGADLAYENNGESISIRDSFRKNSKLFSNSFKKSKTNLEYRYSELKEAGFLKEFREGGEKYYTIKL